ncbi:MULTISPECIES: hypothetical protein [unclassified Pseudomonas]|uniref:hypothetical protein n=1 Tax=unclassified Pseudomonas TaxID=196821 RepID=UPI00131A69C9|nr:MULTISPECIES: hypothetical protein [unclassified Pseudomonas]
MVGHVDHRATVPGTQGRTVSPWLRRMPEGKAQPGDFAQGQSHLALVYVALILEEPESEA